MVGKSCMFFFEVSEIEGDRQVFSEASAGFCGEPALAGCWDLWEIVHTLNYVYPNWQTSISRARTSSFRMKYGFQSNNWAVRGLRTITSPLFGDLVELLLHDFIHYHLPTFATCVCKILVFAGTLSMVMVVDSIFMLSCGSSLPVKYFPFDPFAIYSWFIWFHL